MTEADVHLLRIRAKEGRITTADALALIAEIERLERVLAEAHGTIQGLRDALYGRVPSR